ncbi:MAG: hypothetical protein HYX65_01165 [Gemmatimonadetes bacterium]|nr:hypothetical protein [Gemmatimonadota bacterium]
MHSNTYRMVAVAAVAVTLAACNSSDSTSAALTTQSLVISQDLANEQGATVGEAVQNVLGAEAYTGASSMMAPASLVAVGGTADLRTCSGPDASGWFSCTNEIEDGFTVARSHRFFNSTGFALGWGPGVDSAQYRWSETGTDSVSADRRPAGVTSIVRWVNRGDSASLRPIRTVGSEARIWNFRGARNDSSLVKGDRGSRFYKIAGSRTGTNVTWLLPRLTHPWPASGTIAQSYTATVIFTNAGATKADTTVRTGSASVTFNGTQTVPVIVGAMSCSLDLLTRKVSGCTGS